MIKIGTHCSGIGAPEQAIKNLNIPHRSVFACEKDIYARKTFLANHQTDIMVEDMTTESWEDPKYYSDLYVAGIPCQAFSLAGKRLGELDKRGLLFYDFYRYVKNQQPKVFMIENVKGLLSDNNGVTFQNWIALLGQSMNTHLNMFNHEDSLMYNLHFKVLNLKDFGLPQNRERVFLVGIRNDLPNTFRFPKGWKLKLKLKDLLEPSVDAKYFLSDKMVAGLIKHDQNSRDKGRNFHFEPLPFDTDLPAKCIRANSYKSGPDDNFIKVGYVNQDTQASMVYSEEGLSPALTAGSQGYSLGYVQVARERRTEEARAERRQTGNNGFRGKEVVFEESDVMNCLQTAPTNDNLIKVGQIVLPGLFESAGRVYSPEGIAPTLTTKTGGGHEPYFMVNEATKKGYAVAVDGDSINFKQTNSKTRRGRVGEQVANALMIDSQQAVVVKDAIRRLTPTECLRLMGQNTDTFDTAGNSDTQIYKQAGNSIGVTLMEAMIMSVLPILK